MADSESQIRFVRHNFENLQALIRFADAKAGALMGFVALLAGGAYAIAQNAARELKFETLTFPELAINSLFCVAWVVFWFTSLGTILYLLREVVFPRRASQYGETEAGGHLMYWEHILFHRSMSSYFEAVCKLSPDLELKNLTDQCYELATILDRKLKALSHVGPRTAWIAGSWLCGTLLALILVSSRAH